MGFNSGFKGLKEFAVGQLLLLLPLALQPIVGFGLSNNLSIFSYLSPTRSIFSFPALEDLFLLLLFLLSWVFLFVSSLPVFA